MIFLKLIIKFNSIEELYKRVYPALQSKKKELIIKYSINQYIDIVSQSRAETNDENKTTY